MTAQLRHSHIKKTERSCHEQTISKGNTEEISTG